MESFLLFCNTVLIALIVALAIIDERRRAGAPETSPFRVDEGMAAPGVQQAPRRSLVRKRRRSR